MNNPFIVCMTYAFQTPDKLCFVLDLMNGRLAVNGVNPGVSVVCVIIRVRVVLKRTAVGD